MPVGGRGQINQSAPSFFIVIMVRSRVEVGKERRAQLVNTREGQRRPRERGRQAKCNAGGVACERAQRVLLP